MSVEVEVNENDLAEMVEQVWMSYLDPAGVSPERRAKLLGHTTVGHKAAGLQPPRGRLRPDLRPPPPRHHDHP